MKPQSNATHLPPSLSIPLLDDWFNSEEVLDRYEIDTLPLLDEKESELFL